jgi:hypothetical protein
MGSRKICVKFLEYCCLKCVNNAIINDTIQVAARHRKPRVGTMTIGQFCGLLTRFL